jgi:hypothetical protein
MYMHWNQLTCLVSALCGIGLALIVGCGPQPYGFEHRKRYQSEWLASETLAWKKRGANDNELSSMQFTNRGSGSLSRYQTNIVVNGASYETVLRFDYEPFMQKGCLVAARDGSVIWVGKDGKCEVTYQAK